MAHNLLYSVLDVFAERPLEGNPLAVFHDARGLSDEQMQALARETNLAETTFVLPDEPAVEAREGIRVRIFTTREELPFAGHPSLGTASWLFLHHPALREAAEVKLRLNIGPINVRIAPGSCAEAGVYGTMQQNDAVFGPEYSRHEVGAVLGLEEADLSPHHLPQTVSTGLPFCIVPLRSLEVAHSLAIPQRAASAWLAEHGSKFFYCIAPADNASGGGADAAAQWHARMQFYSGEDPATGSAAGCCAAWLVRHGLAPSGQPVVLEQGIEMQRPSRITVQATFDGERIGSVLVSGRTIPVATGAFRLG